MNIYVERELIENAKQKVAEKTTSLGDSEYRGDITKYVSQDRFELELEKVFKALPRMLLHSSELPEPNSFQALETAHGSVIVSRDADGKAHVFRNACRHRGAKLVDGSGCNKRIICPYHAWSYATDGSLSNVPGQAQCFPNLDKETSGLLALPCIEKHGFIWLVPEAGDFAENSAEAEAILDQHLGDMAAHMTWLAPQNLTFFKRTTKVWDGNWKLFAEGGLETYHFAFAHKETIASSFYNNVAVIDQLDKHFRVVMPTRELEGEDVQSLHDCSHTLFFLLPSAAILVQKEHADWIEFRPLAPGKTEIAVTSLIPKDVDLTDEKQHGHWQKNHHITNVTLDEDWALGTSIQKSIEDGGLPYIQYGKNEWALHALNELLDDLLAGR